MNNFKRFLSLALAVLMTLSYAPTIAFGLELDTANDAIIEYVDPVEEENIDTEIIEEGGLEVENPGDNAVEPQLVFISGVESFNELKEYLTNGKYPTIQLAADIYVTETIVIPAGITVTLDLMGHNITSVYQEDSATKHIYPLDVCGNLTIKDTAKTGSISGRGIYARDGSTLTINDAKVIAEDWDGGACVWGYGTSKIYLNNATLIGNTGVVSSQGPLEINGGTYTCYSGIDNDGKQITNPTYNIRAYNGLKITDGTFTSRHGVISVAGGEAVIEKGSYTIEFASATTSNVVYISGTTDLTIKDGEFLSNNDSGKADSGAAVLVSGSDAKLTIEKGTYVGMNGMVSGNANTVIKGGSFDTVFDVNSYGELDTYVEIGATVTVDGTKYIKTVGGNLAEFSEATGTVTPAYTSENKIWGEGTANSYKSFVVKLYEGEKEIASASLNNIGGIIDGDVYVTWSIPFDVTNSEDSYWTVAWAEGYPKADMAPDKVVLVSDGKEVANNNFQLNGPDNLNKIVASAEQNGKFMGYYTKLSEAIGKFNGRTVYVLRDVTEDISGFYGVTFVSGVEGGVTITDTNTDWVDFDDVIVRSGVTVNIPNAYSGDSENVIEGTLNVGETYYHGYDAKTTIQNGGKVTVGGSTILRYNEESDSGIYVYGDSDDSTVEFDCNYYIGAYSGTFYAENATIETGYFLLKNSYDDDNYANIDMTLDNSSLTVVGTTDGQDSFIIDDKASLTLKNGASIEDVRDFNILEGAKLVLSVDESSSIQATNINIADDVDYKVVDDKIVAKEYVAQIGEEKYESLQDAVDAAADGNEIVLLTELADVDATINKNITLNLGGNTLTDANIKIAANVTIKNGSIKNGSIKNTSEPYPLVVTKGELTVEAVDIEASASDRTIWLSGNGTVLNFNSGSILATKGENNNKSKIYGVWVSTGATANINGGSITVDAGPDATAVAIFGNYTNANVTVNGGKISTSGKNYSYGIHVDGDITVNGGEIVTNEKSYGYSSGIRYGNNYALVSATGDVTITGGTITTNGYSGYIVNVGRTYSSNDQTVSITGGTFTNNLSNVEQTTGGHKAPVLIWEGTASDVTATISGGDFRGFSEDLLRGDNTDLTVSGGNFDVEINEEYLAEDVMLVKNGDGTFSVVTNPAYGMVAKIGDDYYKTFEEALRVVQDGQTITLLGGESTDELKKEIEFTKDIEFTITGNAPKYALPVITFQNATVNIKDAKILVPELDARQNATINVIDSKVYDAGGNSIVKSYYNGAINISGTSEVYTMQVTTMGYITISDTAKLHATWQTNVYGNGIITVEDDATFNTAALQLTAKDYSGRDNTDADRVGKPAKITVDGANFIVGKVLASNGADYSYNSSKGINVGTLDGKSAVLDIKNNANVEIHMANGETANIGANGTVNVEASSFKVECRKADGTVTLENNGTVFVSGDSDVAAANVTGDGWFYMNSVDLDADTKLLGAKVRFASGTNYIEDSVIDDGFFQVGIGAYNGVDNNVDIVNGVTVNVQNAKIGSNGSTYAGWVGTGFYDTDAEKAAVMTDAKYVLNIKNSIAEFGYLHVSNDGELKVTGNAAEKAHYNNSEYSFYAGEIIVNGTATFDETDVLALYTKVSCDNGTTTPGTINIVNGTEYEAERHNGAISGTNFTLYKTGVVNVEEGAKLHIGEYTSIAADAVLNIGGEVTALGTITNNGTIYITAVGATLTTPEAPEVKSRLEDYKVIYENGAYKLDAKVYVAKNTTANAKYESLAEALTAATNGDTIELIWTEGNAPIAMNGAVYGKSVTITGTADVDWSKGFLFIGRGGEGNGTVIFDNAKLTSASNSSSYGIHVSGREKDAADKYDGTLTIKDSTIVLDYLINKGNITLDNSTLTVKNGFSVGGRPAKETEIGEDATATISLTNGSKVVVNNHNGMGLGYEAIGVMNIDKTSAFETTQDFLVTEKGTMNVNGGTVKVAGTLNNKGAIVIDATGMEAGECESFNATIVNTGTVEAVNNPALRAEIKEGEVWLVANVAKIGDKGYATLAEAIAAVKDGETIEILEGTISEDTIKMPATLKNVTIKGAENHASVLKDMTIMAADGNSIVYEGLTFDGIVFDNSRVSITGWRTGEVSVKDLTVTNCKFENLSDETSNAPLHINMAAHEAVENLTFTNNVIDGATGGSKSGVYAQVTGKTTFTNNVINNVAFRPYVIQITTDDGIADEFIVTDNTFSGSTAGRAQGLGNNAEGTDTVKLVISKNIFKDITSAQQICYWNFNPETTTADFSKNYYDIDILKNPNRFYYNNAAANAEDLIEMGIFPYYSDEAKTTLVHAPIIMVTYSDGNIEYYNDMTSAVPNSNRNTMDGATIKLLDDYTGPGVRFFDDVTLNLNGYTYTVTKSAGSNGTETSGFQLRPESNGVTIKNGTIAVAETTEGSVVWLLNSYTGLTLENVVLDCENLAAGYGDSRYAVVLHDGDSKFTNVGINNFKAKFAVVVADNNSYEGGVSLVIDNFSKTIQLNAGDATITGPEDLDVVTDDGNIIVYEDGVYRAVVAVAKIGDKGYATLAEAIAAVGAGDVVIELLADATFDYNARDAYGTAETTSLTINGNGNTLTLNQKNSDWASLGLANAEAKLVLNNMTIEKTGYGDTSGAWNTHAIIFSCPVEMTDVTVNNSVAVQNGATLNNVTINEANGFYGLWINGNGQTVTVTGGKINATNGGRGIKIADQYIDNPESVTLTVNGTTFNTAKKAAVLVSSTAGAKVTATNVDIANVAEDTVNFVWVDEDWAAYYNSVKVIDCTKAQENEAKFPIKVWYVNGDGKATSVRAYYKTLDELFAAPATQVPGSNRIELRADVVANNKVNVSYGSNRVYSFVTDVENGVTMDFEYADNWNMLPKFDLGENIIMNVPYLQVIGGDIEIAGTLNTNYLYLYGTGEGVTITETGKVTATTGDATVQVKGGTVLTVNGELNTSTLNVWTEDVNNSELIVSGANAKVIASHFHAWNGKDGVSAQKVVVENGATLTATNFQADRGSEVTVDAAKLSADEVSLGYGDNIGRLALTNGAELEITNNGTLNVSKKSNYTVDETSKTNLVASVIKADGTEVCYTSFKAAVDEAQAGETVTIYKGEYTGNLTVNKAITVVGEQDAEGKNLVTINGKLSVSGKNVIVKNLNVNNPSNTAAVVSGGNILIEGCNVSGYNGFCGCYANEGDVTIKDCVIEADTYSVHFDAGNGDGDVIIDGCEITGWNSFGSAIEEVRISDTHFRTGNYGQLRFYQNAVLDNVTFDEKMNVDWGKADVEAGFNNCEVENDGKLTDIISLGDIATMPVKVYENGKLIVVEAKVTDSEDNAKYYLTLAEAVAEAPEGATVTLLEHATGAGVVIDKDLTIDFNGKTYTVNKAVGSAGTETLGFQIREGNNVTLKNGTLTATTVTEGKAIKMLVQNYADLTLTNMNLNGVYTGSAIEYVLSNNSGVSNINGATSITAPANAVAFDVYDYSSAGYAVPAVNVNTTGLITGNIAVSETATLAISDGTFTYAIEEAWCAEGYVPVKLENNLWTVSNSVVAQNMDTLERYGNLSEALAAAQADETVKLLKSITVGGYLIIEPNVTLDLNGKVLTASYLVSFGGQVIDNGDGGIKIPADRVVLVGNEYLPIYTTGVYKFFEYNLSQNNYAEVAPNETIMFFFKLNFTNKEAYKVLADNASVCGIDLKIVLDWSTNNGNTLVYNCTAEDINSFASQQYVGVNAGFFLTATGLSDLHDVEYFKANLTLDTVSGVEAISADNLYNLK